MTRLRAPGPSELPVRLTAAVLVTALAWGLGSCSDDGEPAPVGPSTEPDALSTGSPGPEIEGGSASFQAPIGFSSAEPDNLSSPAVLATGPQESVVSLVEVELAGTPPVLDRQEDIALEGFGPKFTAEEPLTVDGVEMWHLSSPDSRGLYVDVYGAVFDGTAVRLTIRLSDEEYDDAERAAVNEQVLASWSWA